MAELDPQEIDRLASAVFAVVCSAAKMDDDDPEYIVHAPYLDKLRTLHADFRVKFPKGFSE